ncbi:hypothetical protein [Flavobacterium gelatinilyticum]|uniref:hypothetical protein n=1 Tax=Flavobacterium gelatinilyticum TaxID=3003260 RepID=UPI00248079D8|nr:hypothetical protein [Flavobacterium gelatinilyticum]
MKNAILCAAMSAILFAVSCQKDNSLEDKSAMTTVQKQNWLTVDLDAEFANSQKEVTAYLFSTKELTKLVKTPNVTEVHFVLGYSDHTIQISTAGVDANGKKLGEVNSVVLKETDYSAQLSNLNESTLNTTAKRTPLQNAHIMSPQVAFAGITAWQQKLNSVSDLDEVTSFEGTRFRYFSLESSIIEDMVKKNPANIGLFLGLNSKGKVTTILVGLDKNNAVKKTSLTSKEAEDVYDGTRPVPPFGDPEP